MADTELAKALRDLPNRVLNVNVDERPGLFQNITNVLTNPGINTTIIRGICKVIGTTLTKYKDPKSQALVKDLIVSLAKQHSDLTFEHFNNVLKTIVSKDLAGLSSLKSSQAAVIALVWSISLVSNADRKTDVGKVEFFKLIELQAALYQLGISGGNERVSERAYQLLTTFWSQNDDIEVQYFTRLLTLEPASSVIVCLSTIIRYRLGKNAADDLQQKHKEKLLEHFIKGLVTVKVKPNVALFTSCSQLLQSLDDNEFKKNILPALQRAMLRSPEIILQGVGAIIHEVDINCSDFAFDLGRTLVTNMYSKNDLARLEAVESFKEIAMKCNDSKAVEALVKHVFAVVNGCDGKITVAEYRINILQGAGYLSYNMIPKTELPGVLSLITDSFIKVLETEIHEKVLCHALDMFGLWAVNYSGELPKKIIEAFKKGIEIKSATPAVRLSYIQWLLACLDQSTFPTGINMSDALVKTVEKASQNATQIPLVAEAICSACIVLKTDEYNPNKLTNFWNIMFDMSKQLFVSEKFILSAPAETLCYVALMSEILLSQHLSKLRGSPDPLYKALIYAITSSSKKVQNCASGLVKRLITNSDASVDIIRNLLKHFNEIAQTSKVLGESESTEEYAIPVQTFIDAVVLLCCSKEVNAADGQLIAMEALICCHQPVAYATDPNLWENIVQKLGLEPKSFISLNIKQIQSLVIENYKPTPIFENTVALAAKLCPQILLPIIIDQVTEQLNNPDMLNVTDDEYFTYLTPDGELYDKSVIPNNDDIYKDLIKKRENKVYSYKEQLEEIQLRREIEEKKRKDGTWKPPQLTHKQKEAIKNQTEKENATKERLKQLNNTLLAIVSLIKGALYGNGQNLQIYYARLLPKILQVLKSPLAADSLTKLYYELRTTCKKPEFEELMKKLSITTLRMFEPHCDLNETWTANKLDSDIVSVLQLFGEKTIGDGDNLQLLLAPEFCYAFEFIKKALFHKAVAKNEDLLLLAIQIISKHVQVQGDTADGEFTDYRHPKYLPRTELLKILLEIISIHRGRVQSQAISDVLDVAKSNSGEKFYASGDRCDVECLLTALQSNLDVIRDVALRSLTIMMKVVLEYQSDYDYNLYLIRRLWIAKHDISEENKQLACIIWEQGQFEVPIVLCDELLKDVVHQELCIQKASAASIVSILNDDPTLIESVLEQLLETYNDKLQKIPAQLDQFEREIVSAIDQWVPRRGVAIALCHVAPFLSSDLVDRIIQFMVSKGLGDRDEIVHKEMLAAALNIVDLHGKECIGKLLPVFENFLDKAPKSSHYDNIRQAVVILMGSLARHLDKDDERIQPIVKRLLAALSTPSQTVQEAVANCLPHLMPSVKDEANGMIKKLLNQLVKSEKYGERKGAAYGIAAIVKGLGILSLKQLDIMNKLTQHIQEKKNYKSREGALFAFEMLCTTLGRLFEPYIVHVLPHLLQCFGDASQYVRQAADDTARVVMAKLSAHGVKLVLPSLLNALDEDSWRTKTASVELLGAMAYCAPKQLSSCLPSIVPKLIEVLGDSHTKVQEAGGDALRVIGSVIKNPEIQAIVPVLLEALEDPSKNTSKCLHSLLETKFVHFIDAASLALIMPVVQRSFMDRSSETRKMAAQIIGNMYSLTDQKDLAPYLPNILPGLKTSLLDPVPEVRAVSSRALGAMVKGMGESSFEDLLPWLMQTLTSETSSVDRSGAAQGLSEVVGGLGVEKLHKLMPEIIATAERTDIAPHVKDGYIMMFIYMPGAFPNEFTPYIGLIINPILKALADENEYVRDTALKAGQRIVNLYAESAVTLLLPELEKGLFDDNWRIRFSSVQLLGDLLYRISGVSGKMTTETASEDDNFGTEQSHSAIIRFLGVERRNRVLAGLYMGRSDVALMVRQAALHVWKVVVTNTPRTLREILPTLFSLLLGCLASTSHDKRQVAGRTLGDLVRKLGERVLPEIIPILERGLNSDQADQRQGVCIGLSEIMESTSKEMVLTFVNSLVPTVRKALSDPLPEVRKAAAKTFESLHNTVGSRALDDILPSMLNGLSDPDPEIAENTLDGLRQVMAIKSRVVLPYLVPQLTAQPVNTKALSILAAVAGESLTKYLQKILPALLHALSEAQNTPTEANETEYCQAVVLSVSDEVGIRTIMDILMESTKSVDTNTRRSAAVLLCAFCTHSKGDYSQYVPQLLRGLLRLLADEDKDVVVRSWEALSAVIKTLDSSQQIAHVSDVRQAVRYAASELKPPNTELPGFCLPKGITPLLPVFREAILNGLPEEKENAAVGLGEVIALTSASALQPSVVHITGPLIRILGDRFNANVKAAVLETLAILLHKVGILLKQFLPQLQTTFLKSLHDQNRIVRIKSGYALAELVKIHTRADPLFMEMLNGIKSNDDSGERETMLQALRGIIKPAGDKMTDPLRKQVHTTLISMLSHAEDATRSAVGGCLGALCKWFTKEQLNDTLNNHLLRDDPNDDWTLCHGKSAALFVALKECPSTVYTSEYEVKILKIITVNITSDKSLIAGNAIRAASYIFEYCMNEKIQIPHHIVTSYVRAMNHNSNEVKQLLAKYCNYLAKVVPPENTASEFLRPIIPMLVNGTKEKNAYVKTNSEIALIAILRLRDGDEIHQKCLQILDAGARDSLNEVVSKVLRKVAAQPIGKEEELDDTLLS